jgi:hypothetical protein
VKNVIAYNHVPRDFGLNNNLNVDPGAPQDEGLAHTIFVYGNGWEYDELIGFNAMGEEDLNYLTVRDINDMDALMDAEFVDSHG